MEAIAVVESDVEKKRGFCLSAFLILMFIANPLTAFTYLFYSDGILQVTPNITKITLYVMSGLTLLNFALAIAIWFWKKIGVYGLYISMAFAFFLNLYMGIDIVSSLSGLIGAAIVFFTTKKRWQHFS